MEGLRGGGDISAIGLISVDEGFLKRRVGTLGYKGQKRRVARVNRDSMKQMTEKEIRRRRRRRIKERGNEKKRTRSRWRWKEEEDGARRGGERDERTSVRYSQSTSCAMT